MISSWVRTWDGRAVWLRDVKFRVSTDGGLGGE